MSERIVAVVPIRSLRNGKTRLAAVLSEDEREALLRRTAERVVAVARDSGVIDTVLVVSPDAEALAWAENLGPGVLVLPQPAASPGLNGAIDAGRDWALAAGADALLSLFADLPLITPDDVGALAARSEAAVLGPDRRGEGTNALLLRLAGAGAGYRFAFGEGSLACHLTEAARLGLTATVVDAFGIGFDLDTPDDWHDYLEVVRWQTTPQETLLTPMTTSLPILAPCGVRSG